MGVPARVNGIPVLPDTGYDAEHIVSVYIADLETEFDANFEAAIAAIDELKELIALDNKKLTESCEISGVSKLSEPRRRLEALSATCAIALELTHCVVIYSDATPKPKYTLTAYIKHSEATKSKFGGGTFILFTYDYTFDAEQMKLLETRKEHEQRLATLQESAASWQRERARMDKYEREARGQLAKMRLGQSVDGQKQLAVLEDLKRQRINDIVGKRTKRISMTK